MCKISRIEAEADNITFMEQSTLYIVLCKSVNFTRWEEHWIGKQCIIMVNIYQISTNHKLRIIF